MKCADILKLFYFLLFLQGYLPGIFMIESMMDNVARSIGMDVEQFKQVNFYKKGDVSIIVRKENSNKFSYHYCSLIHLKDFP